MFGLSLDDRGERAIIPPTELTLCPGQIVFITGVSGGGKSTLLRLIRDALRVEQAGTAPPAGVVSLDALPALPDAPLVDALAYPEGEGQRGRASASLEVVCRWLSLAGLNDAAVMLRCPGELSDGQRHRLRLAQAMAIAERGDASPCDGGEGGWSLLLADEFGSSLDRTTARALSRCVRRWVTRSGVCLVAATAHDDLLEPLEPDVLVEVAPAGRCAVHLRDS